MNATARQTEAIILALILLIGAGLRLAGLGQTPPGYNAEEMLHIQDAYQVLDSGPALTFSSPGQPLREPLFAHISALAMAISGRDPLVARGISAAAGTGLLLLVYLWVRVATQNRWLALATTAGLSVSFWGVMTSRLVYRAILFPVFFTSAAITMRRGIRVEEDIEDDFLPLRYRPRAYIEGWYWFVISGALLGITFYVHPIARIMWMVFPAFFIFLSIDQPRVLRRTWLGLAVMLCVATIIASPILFVLIKQPFSFFSDPFDMSLSSLCPSPVCDFQATIRARLGIIAVRGDALWAQNISHKPLLGPLMSLLFFLGISVAVMSLIFPYRPARRKRRSYDDTFRITSANVFMLLTLAAGMAPVILGGVNNSTVLAIGAQPALYYFPAVAIMWMIDWARRRIGEEGATALWVSYGITLLVIAALNIHLYFGAWAQAPPVKRAFGTFSPELPAETLDS
jgi:hypothetical protein